jgi:CHAT domain-containing protein
LQIDKFGDSILHPMKHTFRVALVAMVWATWLPAQWIPDYAFLHTDTTRPLSEAEVLVEKYMVPQMLHDSIRLAYEAGKDEVGIQQLVRWKSLLQKEGDTLGIDYFVVLTDLGLAMLRLGCYDAALDFLERVPASPVPVGILGNRLRARASRIATAAATLASRVPLRILEDKYADAAQDFDDSLDLDTHGVNLIISQDSILYEEFTLQYSAMKLQIEAALVGNENVWLRRRATLMQLAIDLARFNLIFESSGTVDMEQVHAFLQRLNACDFPGGSRHNVAIYVVEFLGRAGKTSEAIAFAKHTRQQLYQALAVPRQTHFGFYPYVLVNLTLVEAQTYLNMHRPDLAIAAIRRRPAELRLFQNRIQALVGGFHLDWVPNTEELLIYQQLISAYCDPKIAQYDAALEVGEDFFALFETLYLKELNEASQIYLTRMSVPTVESVMAAAVHKLGTTRHAKERMAICERGLRRLDAFRGRLLRSQWQNSIAMHGLGFSAATTTKIQNLRRQLTDCQSMRLSIPEKADSLKLVEALLEQEEKRLLSAGASLTSPSPLWASLESAVSLPEIQAQLQADEALVYYFEGLSYIFRFTLQKDTLRFDQIQKPGWIAKRSISRSQFAKEIRALSQAYQTPQRYQSTAHALVKLLWPWPDPASAPQKIAIFPDGHLWSLPFDALTYGDSSEGGFQDLDYLLRYHEISYWPGLKMWETARFFQTTTQGAPMMAICPGFLPAAAPDLRACDTTVPTPPNAPLGLLMAANQQLSNRYQGKFLLGEAATEQALKQALAHAGVMSIATHAVVDREDALASYISMYPNCGVDGREDGRLHAYEIHRQHFPLDLVMLWGCTTGGGRNALGEGQLSIGRAFVASGAKSVLMSQWEMEEEPTARMMELYYEALAAGEGKAQALRTAKLRYIAATGPLGAEPHRWAGWVLMGDVQSIAHQVYERPTPTWEWALGALALGAVTLAALSRHRRRHRART